MRIAVRAFDFNTLHAMAGIQTLRHSGFFDRLVIAWPATARIVFVVGTEQLSLAGRADIGAVGMMVPIFAGKGALCLGTTANSVLLGAEFGPPLGVGFFNFLTHVGLQMRL